TTANRSRTNGWLDAATGGVETRGVADRGGSDAELEPERGGCRAARGSDPLDGGRRAGGPVVAAGRGGAARARRPPPGAAAGGGRRGRGDDGGRRTRRSEQRLPVRVRSRRAADDPRPHRPAAAAPTQPLARRRPSGGDDARGEGARPRARRRARPRLKGRG